MAPSKRKLPPAMILRVGEIVRDVVEKQFGGNQTRASKSLGLSQAHVSALINGDSGRGPGLYSLIRLREMTGRSLDDILGLTALPGDELIRGLRETVEAHLLAQLKVKEAALEALKQLEPKREPSAPKTEKRKPKQHDS